MFVSFDTALLLVLDQTAWRQPQFSQILYGGELLNSWVPRESQAIMWGAPVLLYLHTPGSPTPSRQLLEDQGFVITASALRLGYFYGGDGDLEMKVDVRNAAGTVRSPGTVTTVFMLPIKSIVLCRSLHAPCVEEGVETMKIIMWGPVWMIMLCSWPWCSIAPCLAQLSWNCLSMCETFHFKQSWRMLTFWCAVVIANRQQIASHTL